MKLWSIAAGVALLCACGSAKPPASAAAPAKACEPTGAELSIAASKSANATVAGQGRPVQVRVYVLKNDARLRLASFEDIWEHDAQTLQGDLLKMDEHTAYPGASFLVKVPPNPEAHQIAAVALFRQPQGKSWFVAYDVPPPNAATAGKCQKDPPRMQAWLDRMQIQDGPGQSEGSD